MTKDEFNTIFREYTRNSLSPTQKEMDFVAVVYKHICVALNNNCIQIGSYPRFTASRPLHDLDILYILGDIKTFVENPTQILLALQTTLQNYFGKNTTYKVRFELQTHSVTISFFDENNKEYFGIDVVPAFIDGKNEFYQDMYLVPEIVKVGRNKRGNYYQTKKESRSSIQWIKSDPRGYIQIASNINDKNSDYRKAVKFAKKWKHSAADKNENFKLKSFHVEQIFVSIFQNNPNICIFDAIFEFFYRLPIYIKTPQIKDRANADTYIDGYLKDLTEDQRTLIIQTKDCFLLELENFTTSSRVSELLDSCQYVRQINEEFLFDSGIPVLIEPSLNFRIVGRLKNMRGFREYTYDINMPRSGKIDKYNFIKFDIDQLNNNTCARQYKWKVRNDDSSPEPRGEITDNQTKNYPEKTVYDGNHYVECYAIKNNICIAKQRIPISI